MVTYAKPRPTPREWTPNDGPDPVSLREGMLIRLPGGRRYRVVSEGVGSVTISPLDGRGKPHQIARHSQVEYCVPDPQGIDSGARYVIGSSGARHDDQQINEGGSQMPRGKSKNKVSATPVAGTEKAARKSKSKSSKAAKSNSTNPCICGCGGETGGFFVPGHDARFKGWLLKIARGDNKPTDFMSAGDARKMGPWTDTEDGGKAPTNTYHVLRG